jgi:Domain of unknown function (DUF1905)/Bacteriocin-protection, YdeI or OmpD-Associated
MISFSAIILKFKDNKEKTGWSYIKITKLQAGRIKKDARASFRVKGYLDNFAIQKTSILPMGDGEFILPFNAAMRKGTGKQAGDKVNVKLQLDERSLSLPVDFLQCLKDDPRAYDFFRSLTKSHQNYFGKWIDSAKTISTKTKRITMAVIALGLGQGYSEMMRANKKE